MIQEQGTASSDELTQLLRRWSAGDMDAAELVVDRAYQELRIIVSRYVQAERIEHTLGPTALDQFLRILNSGLQTL